MDDFTAARQSFMQGLQHLEASRLVEAEASFLRSLELLPDRVSTLNNLSAVKLRLQKFAEAECLARKAIAVESKSPEAWANLGFALTKLGRHEEALRALDLAEDANPFSLPLWVNKAATLLELLRCEEALQVCDAALKLNPDSHELLLVKSRALKELGRLDEARKVYVSSLARRVAQSPVFITDRHATQKADILIVSPDPFLDDSMKAFETLHLDCPNFPGQIARRTGREFHFTFVFRGDAVSPDSRGQIPKPQVLINNCTNGEAIAAKGELPALTELVESFGVPVVNHPANAVPTARDTLAKRLENMPDVRVPRTARFSTKGKSREEVVREIEAQFNYPLITRSLTAQKGVGMDKVDSRSALQAKLEGGLPEQFFVTEFLDTRNGETLYRKIRAAVVQDEIVLVRVDYHENWKVHGGRNSRRVEFYRNNRHLLEIEQRICADPEKELGRRAVEALRAIRARIPLDIFGIDFDVDASGAVVFFEANATMNLLTNAVLEVTNPLEQDERLKRLICDYLLSLVGRG